MNNNDKTLAHNQRGFSLIEVMVSGTLFALMFGAMTTVMVKDQTAIRVVTAQVGPETKARHTLAQIAAELKMASIQGEDRNQNGELDPYEDVNVNYYFDAAWNLDDGTKDQAEMEFNRRLSVSDSAEDLAEGTTYSAAIAYRIENNRLVRRERRLDPSGSEVIEVNQVIQDGISGLRFSREGFIVTVSIDVLLPEGAYKTPIRTLSERVLLRN